MGKYDKVLGALPKATPDGDTPFRDKVEALKVDLSALSPTQLAEAYAELRGEKEKMDAAASELNVRITAVEESIWGAFEDAGLSSLKLKSGQTVRVQPEPYAAVKDKDALREWALRNDLGRLLALPWQTVNSLAKERLLNGDAAPDGVEVTVRTKTVFSKK